VLQLSCQFGESLGSYLLDSSSNLSSLVQRHICSTPINQSIHLFKQFSQHIYSSHMALRATLDSTPMMYSYKHHNC